MSLANVNPCDARTRAGGSCRQPSMPNGRCRMHGGRTPRGLKSPHLRTALYAQDLPPNLLDRFEEALCDRELLGHHRDAALLTSMISAKLAELKVSQENADVCTITEMVENIANDWRGWDWTRTDQELQRL